MFSRYGSLSRELMQKETVYHLAEMCVIELLADDVSYSHLIAATSCPDTIAPSLGQCINQQHNEVLSNTHTIDIVQGCAGGVTALIIASQMAELNHTNVLLVTSDAAKKATSPTSDVYPVFNNGVFGCNIAYTANGTGLLHYASKQYKDLYDVVTIKLGHDADVVICENMQDMTTDPRKHLGLTLNNHLAMKLMRQAEGFYLDFISTTGHPDILILHQVNEMIIHHLEHVFSKHPVRFINMAKQTGNCGCATTGIVLHAIKDEIKNKKVMICSFGTGGVITAGLWQF